MKEPTLQNRDETGTYRSLDNFDDHLVIASDNNMKVLAENEDRFIQHDWDQGCDADFYEKVRTTLCENLSDTTLFNK